MSNLVSDFGLLGIVKEFDILISILIIFDVSSLWILMKSIVLNVSF